MREFLRIGKKRSLNRDSREVAVILLIPAFLIIFGLHSVGCLMGLGPTRLGDPKQGVAMLLMASGFLCLFDRWRIAMEIIGRAGSKFDTEYPSIYVVCVSVFIGFSAILGSGLLVWVSSWSGSQDQSYSIGLATLPWVAVGVHMITQAFKATAEARLAVSDDIEKDVTIVCNSRGSPK